MSSFSRKLQSISFVITAVLSGILLFAVLSSYEVKNSVMNADFHKNLFNKNNVYEKTYSVISNSINDFISNLKEYSPQNFEQHKSVFTNLEKSVTPELVNKNLDSIREGMFQYFKGERVFLPDITIASGTGNSSGAGQAPSQSLSQIEKVNLNAILLYINRNDISDSLQLFKLVYFIFQTIPGFLLLILLMLSFIGLILSKKAIDVARWLGIALLSSAITSLVTGFVLLIYAYVILPGSVHLLTLSVPLEAGVVTSYLRDCINHVDIFLVVTSIFSILLAVALFSLKRFSPTLHSGQNAGRHTGSARKKLKYSVYSALLLVMAITMSLQLQSLYTKFKANEFSSVLSRIKSVSTVTQVIPAKEDNIFELQVNIVDKATNLPMKNILVNISGTSVLKKKDFNDTLKTDSNGIAKYTLDRGTFRLSIVPLDFPENYQHPSPFFFDLKESGKTIMTVKLEPATEDTKPQWGIAELEILDEANNPVQGLELGVKNPVSAPGNPDKALSYTNSEGIAVFKLNTGKYKVSFSEAKVPEKYHIPPPVNITISPDTVTRYTLRLVELNSKTAVPKQN